MSSLVRALFTAAFLSIWLLPFSRTNQAQGLSGERDAESVVMVDAWCAGPPILARAFSWPKHVGVIHSIVLVAGPMGKTFETTCLTENHHGALIKALDQARSVRQASCQFRRPVRGGLIAKIASKPSIKNRPSTATKAAIGSDKTCNSDQSDFG